MRHGRPHVLVRWAGRDASGDTAGEPLDKPTGCAEAIAAFGRATGRGHRARPSLARQPPPPLLPRPFPGRFHRGRRPGDLEAAVVGQRWWGSGLTTTRLSPDEGWRHRTSLPARRILARGGLLPTDVGAARRGGYAA